VVAHDGVTIDHVHHDPRDDRYGDRADGSDGSPLSAPRHYGDDILQGLRLARTGRILDLGCGAGHLSARLAALVPGGEVLGLDPDRDMVAAARLRYPGDRLSFEVCRPQDVATLVRDRRYDLVVSRAALHQVPAGDHPDVLAAVFGVLRPGGVFRAEFGGAGQIAAVRRILDAESLALGGAVGPWFHPGPEDYRPLLLGAGFQVSPDGWVCLLHRRMSMATETELVTWLRGEVLLAYEPGLPAGTAQRFRGRAEERAIRELRRSDGTFDQDFVRLDLSATRPKAESLA
jgi:trans-aconitate methyltransferase